MCHNDETILDVCCGNGLFFLNTKRKRFLVGVDNSENLLKEAKKIFHDNAIEAICLVRGDAFRLPFKAETFDRVFCINTLLNLPSLDSVETLLVELMRICKARGKLVVEIRNYSNLYIRLKYWIHSRKQKFPIKTYKIEDICSILKRHKFHCTQILPVGYAAKFMAKAFLLEAGRMKHL